MRSSRLLLSAAKAMNGKVVVISGASSGIGEQLCHLYAAQGAKLVLSARRVDKLNEVANACTQKGAEKVCTVRCDVAIEDDCKKMVNDTIEKFGQIDVLILNAGIGQSFFLEAMYPEVNIRQFMDINYYGCVNTTIAALPHLHKTGGRIAIVSSLGGLMPFPRQTLYNASKHALIGFYDTLRLEMMAKKTGVSITMICPGFVKTEMTTGGGGGIGRDGKPLGAKVDGSVKSVGGLPIITAEQCAQEIVAAVTRRDRLLITPGWYKYLAILARNFPSLSDKLMAKMFLPKIKK